MVIVGALALGMTTTAFAANDPLTVVNNLSDFIFGLIRAIGMILLGFGIVQIGLKRENNGTNDYSVATFKLLQDFQGEELAQIRAYANSFKEQIKLLLQQRAEITEEQRDTGCDYVIEPGAMTNEPADGHYTVSQINGDCEQLPA